MFISTNKPNYIEIKSVAELLTTLETQHDRKYAFTIIYLAYNTNFLSPVAV